MTIWQISQIQQQNKAKQAHLLAEIEFREKSIVTGLIFRRDLSHDTNNEKFMKNPMEIHEMDTVNSCTAISTFSHISFCEMNLTNQANLPNIAKMFNFYTKHLKMSLNVLNVDLSHSRIE